MIIHSPYKSTIKSQRRLLQEEQAKVGLLRLEFQVAVQLFISKERAHRQFAPVFGGQFLE
jgi:hypothetical protein